MQTCRHCKKLLGVKHISFQDVESGIIHFYHPPCAKIVQDIVVSEYINLICRVANHTLERRTK